MQKNKTVEDFNDLFSILNQKEKNSNELNKHGKEYIQTHISELEKKVASFEKEISEFELIEQLIKENKKDFENKIQNINWTIYDEINCASKIGNMYISLLCVTLMFFIGVTSLSLLMFVFVVIAVVFQIIIGLFTDKNISSVFEYMIEIINPLIILIGPISYVFKTKIINFFNKLGVLYDKLTIKKLKEKNIQIMEIKYSLYKTFKKDDDIYNVFLINELIKEDYNEKNYEYRLNTKLEKFKSLERSIPNKVKKLNSAIENVKSLKHVIGKLKKN